MKVRTVFGVGTARYIGLNLPHFVDEEDHDHDSYMVDSPLYVKEEINKRKRRDKDKKGKSR